MTLGCRVGYFKVNALFIDMVLKRKAPEIFDGFHTEIHS